MNSVVVVEDTQAWALVALERSRFLRSSVPDRILQLCLVLTLRTNDDRTQEVSVVALCRVSKTLTFWIWCEICKEYISYNRKLATKTVYLQPEQQHEQ